MLIVWPILPCHVCRVRGVHLPYYCLHHRIRRGSCGSAHHSAHCRCAHTIATALDETGLQGAFSSQRSFWGVALVLFPLAKVLTLCCVIPLSSWLYADLVWCRWAFGYYCLQILSCRLACVTCVRGLLIANFAHSPAPHLLPFIMSLGSVCACMQVSRQRRGQTSTALLCNVGALAISYCHCWATQGKAGQRPVAC